MSQVTVVTGRGIPLPGDDIDTDRIIPARFLRCITFEGLGKQVFADDRSQDQGRHPFDLPQYQGATILVVNRNFGCGSSREHAPQAIRHWGIQAIVGESFAEIFFGNCVAIGVPCVTATPETVTALQRLIESHPTQLLRLDLEALQVSAGEFTAAVTLGDGVRQMFLGGTWDACGQLVRQADVIRQTAARLPYLQGFQPSV
jgi:3-isopropylmalate/(R)-2-methylmalate dehydratase small subunit